MAILILFAGRLRCTSVPKLTRCSPQYFFYFNRILGILVSWTLRLLLWKKQNAYFEIGAISFSLLGGEIIFNDLRYISRNQSLRVVRGESCCLEDRAAWLTS